MPAPCVNAEAPLLLQLQDREKVSPLMQKHMGVSSD